MNIALTSFRVSAALVTSGLLVVLGATAAGAAPGLPAETAQDRGVVTGPAPVCKANPCRSKDPVIRPALNRDTVRSQDWVRDAWSWEIIAPDAGALGVQAAWCEADATDCRIRQHHVISSE